MVKLLVGAACQHQSRSCKCKGRLNVQRALKFTERSIEAASRMSNDDDESPQSLGWITCNMVTVDILMVKQSNTMIWINTCYHHISNVDYLQPPHDHDTTTDTSKPKGCHRRPDTRSRSPFDLGATQLGHAVLKFRVAEAGAGNSLRTTPVG